MRHGNSVSYVTDHYFLLIPKWRKDPVSLSVCVLLGHWYRLNREKVKKELVSLPTISASHSRYWKTWGVGVSLTPFMCIPVSSQLHWEVSAPAHSIKGSNTSKGTERAGGKVQTTSTWVWISVKCVLRDGQLGWKKKGYRWDGKAFQAGLVEEDQRGFKHGRVSSHGDIYVLNLASVWRKAEGL